MYYSRHSIISMQSFKITEVLTKNTTTISCPYDIYTAKGKNNPTDIHLYKD